MNDANCQWRVANTLGDGSVAGGTISMRFIGRLWPEDHLNRGWLMGFVLVAATVRGWEGFENEAFAEGWRR